MLRFFRFCLLTFGSALLLAGCCANEACDCQDARADALYFRFLIDDAGTNAQAFRSSEVDTVWVLRYALPLNSSARHDSISLVRPGTRASELFVLDNNRPFSLVSGRKLHNYEYELRFRDRSRALRRFRVANINLDGDFEGDGCCTCYVNRRKTAEVNGRAYTLTETDRQPVIITLTQ